MAAGRWGSTIQPDVAAFEIWHLSHPSRNQQVPNRDDDGIRTCRRLPAPNVFFDLLLRLLRHVSLSLLWGPSRHPFRR